MTIDEDLLRAARKAALHRNTSVNQMVREYLAATMTESSHQLAAVAKLDEPHRPAATARAS